MCRKQDYYGTARGRDGPQVSQDAPIVLIDTRLRCVLFVSVRSVNVNNIVCSTRTSFKQPLQLFQAPRYQDI